MMSDEKGEQGHGLPVGWGPWQPAERVFWTLARSESFAGTGIVAEAAEDGRWVVFHGGGAKGTAVARPGESATGAAQREAVAALWARDGFGVGEVRGVRLGYINELYYVTLPGLSGLWHVRAVRKTMEGVEVDAVRAPVAEPAPLPPCMHWICRAPKPHTEGDATCDVVAEPAPREPSAPTCPRALPCTRLDPHHEDDCTPEPSASLFGLGLLGDAGAAILRAADGAEPPAPTGDPGADLTELLPGLPAAVATLRGIASLQLGEPYREIAQQVALGAELLLGERATQPKALASYLDVQWSDEPMREGETVAEQAIRLLEDRREKQDIATRTVLAQGAEIATLRARVDELEAAVRQVEQERSCDLAVLDATAANLHSAERRLATLGAPTPLDLAGPVHVACFAEDEFADIEHFATVDKARAFASGYTSGAGQYGAGACAAYVLPAQEHEMKAVEKEEQWKLALAGMLACDAAPRPVTVAVGDLFIRRGPPEDEYNGVRFRVEARSSSGIMWALVPTVGPMIRLWASDDDLRSGAWERDAAPADGGKEPG